MSLETSGTMSLSANGEFNSTVTLATQKVEEVVQTGELYLSRIVYTTCYCASYGVTFPVVFLAHLIPGAMPLAAGIADGARAAGVYVHGVRLSQQRYHRTESPSEEAPIVI